MQDANSLLAQPTSQNTRRIYLNGALEARAFLLRTQAHVRGQHHFQPRMLRRQLAYYSENAYPPAFVRGFIDAIGAYLAMSLAGREVDLQTWEVLAVVERRR